MRKVVIKICVLVVGLTLGSNGFAIPVHIKLGTARTMDPESAAKVLKVLNPSGTAEMTYFPQGLQFTFTDESNHQKTLKVHFEYRESDLTIPKEQITDLILSTLDTAKERGFMVAGKVLTEILAKPNGSTLFFDSNGKPGYVHSDFDARAVELAAPESGVVGANLKSFVFQSIYSSQAMAYQLRTQQVQMEQAKLQKKNPVGFIWDSEVPLITKNCQEVLAAK